MVMIRKEWLYVLIFAVIALTGSVFFSLYKNRNTVTLFFQSASDGSVVAEKRYIPKTGTQSDALLIVDELLLGPIDHTLLRFTDSDISPNSCFIRSDCLYLDLPATVLQSEQKTADFKTFYTLLQKALHKNVSDIKTMYLFIDGVPAYQNGVQDK